MGLFSSKKKITVATQAMRAIDDNALPDSVRSGLMAALFQNDDIPNQVMEHLIQGIGFKADRMFEYARQHYVHGLPSGQYFSNDQGTEALEAILTAQENAPVTLQYHRIAPPNTLHVGWMKIIADYGYNPTTNQLAVLSAQKGFPVSLTDMVVCIPPTMVGAVAAEVLQQWGISPRRGAFPNIPANLIPHTPVMVDSAATDDYVRVEFTWSSPGLNSTQIIENDSINIPVTGYDDTGDYLQVAYTVNGLTKYWMYLLGSGAHPTLDTLVNQAPEQLGSFFPFAYFRYGKQSTNSDKTSQDYLTSRRLLKYIGIDYDMVADGINGNPDVADVEQAMLIMAVPANSSNPLECRYLYDFFDGMYLGSGGGAQFGSGLFGNLLAALLDKPLPRVGIVIQDQRFKMSLNHQGIFKTRKAGSTGPRGSYSSILTTETREESYTDDQDNVITYLVPTKAHRFRYQITSALYDEIVVVGLQVQYHIYGGYSVIADEADDILLIPLDRVITKRYTTVERETLYARSLHYVFNSVLITKVKWYQTGLFKALMVIVAVVITVLTYGATWEAMAAAIATTGLTVAIVMSIVLSVIEFLLVTYAFRLFVKKVGGELATIMAVIAIAYGVAEGIEAGSLAASPFAKDLLSVGNGLAKATGEVYQDELIGLHEEYKLFTEMSEQRWEDIEAANKLLATSPILSPFTFFGESPEQYYNRTVHSGNIGMIGIEAVSNYVERSLSLPTLSSRFGGFYHG